MHALKTCLGGDPNLDKVKALVGVAPIHCTFVPSAIGISGAERVARGKP